jgi:hypothetical protein
MKSQINISEKLDQFFNNGETGKKMAKELLPVRSQGVG